MKRETRIRRANCLALVLLALGSIQMIGYAAGSRVLRGLGAATVMSPLPKVFSDVDGLETFASAFSLQYQSVDGTQHSVAITPELYGRLAGPYNRRNTYGAALSYAPRLPQPLWESVFCYGLAPNGRLRAELGLKPDDSDIQVTIRTLTQGRDDTWILAPSCTQ